MDVDHVTLGGVYIEPMVERRAGVPEYRTRHGMQMVAVLLAAIRPAILHAMVLSDAPSDAAVNAVRPLLAHPLLEHASSPGNTARRTWIV